MKISSSWQKHVFLLIAILALISCSKTKQETVADKPKPIDPANMDDTGAPGKDFFRYANGAWLDKNPVPAAYGSWGSFHVLDKQNDEVLREILEAAATKTDAPRGGNLQKISDFLRPAWIPRQSRPRASSR